MNCQDIQKFLFLTLSIFVLKAESGILTDCVELLLRRNRGESQRKFSYNELDSNGPSKWGSTCNSGTRQSPIMYDQVPSISASTSNRLRMIGPINTKPSKVNVVNSGYGATYSFTYADASVPQITGGPLNSDVYNFHSFHYHYPCEHMPIKFELFCRLEVHFVHFNSKYGSLENAIDKPDGLAVLGVMYKTSVLNSHKFPYIPLIDRVEYYNAKYDETVNTFSYADAVGFTNIPRIISYKGSLTTPQCSESVTWLVVDELYSISSLNMLRLKDLRDTDGNIMIRNNRPVQPLNGRQIQRYNEF